MNCIADFLSSVILVHSIIFLTSAKMDFTVNYQEYCSSMDTITVFVSVTEDRLPILFQCNLEQYKLPLKLHLAAETIKKKMFASPFSTVF